MPLDVRQACCAGHRLRTPKSISVDVEISAPAATVWDALWAPENGRLVNPNHVDYSGYVPGIPERQVGAISYAIHRHADGRIATSALAVRRLADGQSALLQYVTPPHAETTYVLSPTGAGTRLELTIRMRQRHLKAQAQHGHAVGDQLQAVANGLKALLEET
jgi:hypothetical protein